MTRAERDQAEYGKGVWRRARKTRRCQAFWNKACLGNGQITAGELYFDTQELDGSAGGFGTFCCCDRCANEIAP